jgi:hypothetical protein
MKWKYLVILFGFLAFFVFSSCHNTGNQDVIDDFPLGIGGSETRSLTLVNNASKDVKVYLVFIGGLTGNNGCYTAEDFQSQGCDVYRSDRCSITVPKGSSKTLNLDMGGINISGGLDNEPMGSCPTTMFEINISAPDNSMHDQFDLSLVNGFNYSMKISSSTGVSTKYVTQATGNSDGLGVFPLGCTQCVSQGSNPPAWNNCPGNTSSCGGQCYRPGECKTGPDELHPNVPCVLEVKTGGNFTVTFGNPS